jgi:hypothetical protein
MIEWEIQALTEKLAAVALSEIKVINSLFKYVSK